MKIQPFSRTLPPGAGPVTRTGGSSIPRLIPRSGRRVGHFLAELAGMCAVMCLGGNVLCLAAFGAATAFGYPNLAQQEPELSVVIVTVCLALPMAAYMAIRGHGRRHNLEMTGTTIAVGAVLVGLIRFGVISTSGLDGWGTLFGMVCGPACLIMVVQMLISFGMYSGATRHHGSPA